MSARRPTSYNSTVLIVDDDPDICDAISAYLSEEGIATYCTSSGREGLIWAVAHRPGALLLDWQMPKMDGAEFLELMSIEPALGRVPVILMSANLERIPQALRDRHHCLRKPFDGATMVELLRHALCSLGPAYEQKDAV